MPATSDFLHAIGAGMTWSVRRLWCGLSLCCPACAVNGFADPRTPLNCDPEFYLPVGPDEISRVGVTPQQLAALVRDQPLAFDLHWREDEDGEVAWSETVHLVAEEALLDESFERRYPMTASRCNANSRPELHLFLEATLRFESAQLDARGVLELVRVGPRYERLADCDGSDACEDLYLFETTDVALGERYGAYFDLGDRFMIDLGLAAPDDGFGYLSLWIWTETGEPRSHLACDPTRKYSCIAILD